MKVRRHFKLGAQGPAEEGARLGNDSVFHKSRPKNPVTRLAPPGERDRSFVKLWAQFPTR